MAHRTPNLPDDLREPHTLPSSRVTSLYVKAIGVTILVGLVTGLLWIGWRLFELHVLK